MRHTGQFTILRSRHACFHTTHVFAHNIGLVKLRSRHRRLHVCLLDECSKLLLQHSLVHLLLCMRLQDFAHLHEAKVIRRNVLMEAS